jgi:hypothetical protein
MQSGRGSRISHFQAGSFVFEPHTSDPLLSSFLCSFGRAALHQTKELVELRDGGGAPTLDRVIELGYSRVSDVTAPHQSGERDTNVAVRPDRLSGPS